MLIELLGVDKFRSVATDPPLTGILPDGGRTEPVDGQGLALYVQRTVELRAGSPVGPVVGRLHAGALLSVAAEPTDGFLRVALPGFARPPATQPASLAIYAEARAFGTEARALDLPELSGRRVLDFVPNVVLYATSDLALPFTQSRCSDAYVTAEQNGHSRITQFYAGAEVTGWFEFLSEGPGPIRCGLRFVRRVGAMLELEDNLHLPAAVPSAPREFVFQRPGELADGLDKLESRMRQKGEVFLLVPAASGVRCEPWQFGSFRASARAREGTRGEQTSEAKLGRVHLLQVPEGEAFPSYDVRVDRSALEISLEGPRFRLRPRPKGSEATGPGDSRCGTLYGFVGATTEMFRLLPGGAPRADLVAWHPDDEEHWFLSEAACESQRERSARVGDAGAGASWPSGGVHRDCHPALLR